MQLSDIFSHLTNGELMNVRIGGSEDGQVSTKDYTALTNHVNVALTNLHTELPLRLENVVLQQYDHITTYQLHSDYAETNTESTKPTKYIKDSTYYPFQDNIISIEQIFDEIGEEMCLNKPSDPDSLFSPRFDLLQIPKPVATNACSVVYRAHHPKLVVTKDSDPESIRIDIPEVCLEAICLYVASRIISPIGEKGVQIGINHLARYHAEVQRLRDLSIFKFDDNTDNKFGARGWA